MSCLYREITTRMCDFNFFFGQIFSEEDHWKKNPKPEQPGKTSSNTSNMTPPPPLPEEPKVTSSSSPDKPGDSSEEEKMPAPPSAPAVQTTPLPIVESNAEQINPDEKTPIESAAIEAVQPNPLPPQTVDPIADIPKKLTEIKSNELDEKKGRQSIPLPPPETTIAPTLAPMADANQSEAHSSESIEKQSSSREPDTCSSKDSATAPTPELQTNIKDLSAILSNDVSKIQLNPPLPFQETVTPPAIFPVHKQQPHARDSHSHTSPQQSVHDLFNSQTATISDKLAKMNIVPQVAPVYHVQIQHDNVLPVHTLKPDPVNIKPPAITTEASLNQGFDIY